MRRAYSAQMDGGTVLAAGAASQRTLIFMHEANRLSPAGAPRLGFALTILAAALLAACNPGGRPGAHDLSLATPAGPGAARAAGEASEQGRRQNGQSEAQARRARWRQSNCLVHES